MDVNKILNLFSAKMYPVINHEINHNLFYSFDSHNF